MKNVTLKNAILKDKVSFGNNKLPKSTMIFNLGTASNCPSKALGFCKVCEKCYALKAERLYPHVLPYRQRQAEYWLNTDIDTIKADFDYIISCKREKPLKLRLNEAGDFYSQKCIDKAENLASFLFEKYNIITYTYSARKDLDFTACKFLLVKSSGYNNTNNGKTMVVLKGQEKPADFIYCPGSCKKCSLCSSDKAVNIAFKVH